MGKANRLLCSFSATVCRCRSQNKMCHCSRTLEEGDRGQSNTSSVTTTWVTETTKEMRLITKRGALLLIWILVLLEEVQSFNIAVDRSLLLRGDKNSYFGFSLTLHSNMNGKSVLVGAPRANSTYQRELHEPGAVFQCKLNPQDPCQQIKLDDQDNEYVRTTLRKYKEVKDGQWLGVSVNSQTQNDRSPSVIACGHRWSDVRYGGHHFPNGVCYTINSDLEFGSVEKRLPLVKTGLQITPDNMYYYSMSQMGLATHFTRDGKDLVIGAVGMMDWKGGAVQYSQNEEEIIEPPDVVPFNSYAGYSASSGKFFHDGETYKVIGAPRANNLGKVYIFTGNFEIISEFVGQQFGAYFGAAICVLDVNKDGLDDVLIASPMFKQKHYDEGIVHVYINQNMGAFLKQPNGLTGSSSAGARFGTSMSHIDDINADSFPDVAIGSPYEEDGRGAIYVYLGSRQGVRNKYVQRILASEISSTLRGFGHAISGPLDLDDNGYPDLAVGAYESDETVILYTRPVVYLSSSMNFYPKQLEPGKPTCRHQGELQSCVSLTVTFKYSGDNTPKQLDIQYTIEVDVDKVRMAPRAEFRIDPHTLTDTVTNITTLKHEEIREHEIVLVLSEKITDVRSPMHFRLNYSIVNRLENNNNENDSSLKPVLDATRPTTVIKGVSFVKDCGKDNKCITDLHLQARLASLGTRSFVVIGDSELFSIEIQLFNDGEAAYLSEVTVLFPRHLSFVRVRTISQLGYKVSCIPENTEGDTHLVVCEVGNPIPAHETVVFRLTFDSSKVTENVKELNMTIEAITQSTEDDAVTTDNKKELLVPVEIHTELDVDALSRPEQFTLNKTLVHNSTDTNQAFDRNHIGPAVRYLIDIYNRGPGYLPLATADIKIPLFTKHMKPILHISSVEATAGHKSRTVGVQCSRKLIHDKWTDIRFDSLDPEVNDSAAKSFEFLRVPDFNKYQHTYLTVGWNCSNTICANYICDINSMSVYDNVVISIDAQVQLDTLLDYQSAVSFSITNSILVSHPHNGGQKSSSYHFSTNLNYKELTELPKLRIWVICVAVFVGLFILFIIIIILKKCGFFERKELEELRRLMEQNAENEAMAHMLGEHDDLDNELQFTFHLNPGATMNGIPPDSRATTSDFFLDNSLNPEEYNGMHRNGFLPILGHSGQNGHIGTGRT